MLILDGANDKLQLTSTVAGDLEVQVSWMENNAGTVTPGGDPMASITTATTTDIVAAAGASKQRNVKNLSVFNNHATAHPFTILETDATNTIRIWSGTLLQNEMVIFDETGAWTLYDANGNVKAATFPAALQSEMEAAASNTVSVTPANLNWHPGVAKFWVLFTGNSTTILASWNMTSITDGTTEATVTIATDFSSANWCCQATAEGAVTTVAGARLACTRAIAAGSIIVFCVDGSATTVLADPTRWHVVGFGDQ